MWCFFLCHCWLPQGSGAHSCFPKSCKLEINWSPNSLQVKCKSAAVVIVCLYVRLIMDWLHLGCFGRVFLRPEGFSPRQAGDGWMEGRLAEGWMDGQTDRWIDDFRSVAHTWNCSRTIQSFYCFINSQPN